MILGCGELAETRRSFFLACITSLRLHVFLFADLIEPFAVFQGRARFSEEIPRAAEGAGRDGHRRAQQQPAGVSHTHTHTHTFMELCQMRQKGSGDL